jgi:thiamine-monophosphate kinase
VNEALRLHARYRLSAATDVSDGLTLDLAHLCEESGCGAVVELNAIPIHDDARRLAEERRDGATALDHALSDGEDFELILAAPPDAAQAMLADNASSLKLTRIGEFVAEPGMWSVDDAGRRAPLAPRGFRH